MKTKIFDIQKFCIHDGPGIRTTIFLKGCNMRCIWCHNPESFKIDKQLSYNKEKCVNCGSCVNVCLNSALEMNDNLKINFDKCIACGKCEEACLNDCLTIIGKETSIEDIFIDIEKDRNYYETSRGGITISGGEPSVSKEFLKEILIEAKKRKLHVCIESNGTSSEKYLRSIEKMVDIFLFDYKITDPEDHKKYTGVYQDNVLNNLKILNELSANVILRCPIIPGINDTDEHFEAIRELQRKYKNISKAEIMAYHSIGKDKWERIGYNYSLEGLETVSKEEKEIWESKIKIN